MNYGIRQLSGQFERRITSTCKSQWNYFWFFGQCRDPRRFKGLEYDCDWRGSTSIWFWDFQKQWWSECSDTGKNLENIGETYQSILNMNGLELDGDEDWIDLIIRINYKSAGLKSK